MSSSKQPKSKYTFKILLLGDGAVGKTSLVQRFVHNKFSRNYLMTVGMEPYARYVEIDGVPITLQLWDIAGQDRFASMRTVFFKGALGALVVYDITRYESFKRLAVWMKEARQMSPNILLVMAGNKSDLVDLRQVSQQDGMSYAKQTQCISWIETSAKTGANVAEAFNLLGKKILERHEAARQKR